MLQTLLRSLREARGLKVADVADKLGVVRGTIYAWEAGEKLPDPVNLRALADVYEATETERADLARLRAFGPDPDSLTA